MPHHGAMGGIKTVGTLLDQIKQEEIEDLVTRNDEAVAAEPCGCPACDNGVQSGHFACSQPNEYMLRRERDGLAIRGYDDGAWR